MDSPEVFIAFGAIMLVVALLGVTIDWFGKPLRHRRFVPKIYRFPDERQPRRSKVRSTDWSDRSLVLPVVEPGSLPPLVRYPDPVRAHVDQRQLVPGAEGPPTAQVPVIDLDAPPPHAPSASAKDELVTLEDADPDADVIGDDTNSGSRHNRKQGWTLGDYIFNFDNDGTEPEALTVQTRYWKNVAATSGATIFGEANVVLMTDGEAPRRRNRRTGAMESMTLPRVGFDDTNGETPVPTWPSPEVDPFQ